MTARKPGLHEMLRAVSADADRLYGIERARQKLGEKPDARQLRKVEVLDALGDLIARIIPRVDDVSKAVRDVSIRPMKREGIG